MTVSPPAPAEPGDTDTTVQRRGIRSFVVRAGRMGTGQQKAIDTLGPRSVLPFQAALLDVPAAYGRQAPLVLEIGFGMGAATAQIAAARPDTDFLGVEVHVPGVGALLKRIGEEGLSNLRIVQHDAVQVLEQMVAPGPLAGVDGDLPGPRPRTCCS